MRTVRSSNPLDLPLGRRSLWLAGLLLGVLLGLSADVSLCLPAVAGARPTVTFKMTPVPVPVDPSNPHSPTYPGTGPILGAPLAAHFEYTIRGTEYGGAPSPLNQVEIWAPAGAKLSSTGFVTCAEATIKESGAEGCPMKSLAGPLGSAVGSAIFGSNRVYETVSLQPVFAPGGGIFVYVDGRTPAAIELVSAANVMSLAHGPFGYLVTASIPLVEVTSGADDASVESVNIEVGAAYRRGKRLVSYLTAPKRCPKGGFPLKTTLTFMSGETVSASYNFPCLEVKRK